MARLFCIIGSLSAFLAVALGAFAAHGLKGKLASDLYDIFEVGVRYHLYHSLALFVVAWATTQFPQASIPSAGWLFIAGLIIFSGSLYALSLSGMRWLGAITPIGGICFLGGWLWMMWSLWRAA